MNKLFHLCVALLAMLVAVSAEIKLAFNLPANVKSPIGDVFLEIDNLETTATVANSNTGLNLKTPSLNTVIGAAGSVDVHLAAKTGEDASAWFFASNATIHQSRAGLGAVSEGDSGGKWQTTNGEAFIVTFEIGDLLLTPGAKLVFSLDLSSKDDTIMVYQRTGIMEGTPVTTTVPIQSESGITTDMYMIHEESASAPDKYEFAFVNPGHKGGGANRLKSLTIDVLGGVPVPEPPPQLTSSVDDVPSVSESSEKPLDHLPDSSGVDVNFGVSGVHAEPISDIIFAVKNLAATVNVQSSSNALAYTTPSFNKVVGAAGSIEVQLAAKTGEDVASWHFEADAKFHQVANGGLGVVSAGDKRGRLQMTKGEAVLFTFDTSNLILTPGAKVAFSVNLAASDDTVQVYQRSATNEGSMRSTVPLESEGGALSDMFVIEEESAYSPNIYEFAVVGAGWNGGGPTRIKSFTINVLGGESLGQPPRFHPLFTNNMVLQRRDDVPIHGTAAPGSSVTVSFGSQVIDAVADSFGFWTATLAPMEANTEAQTLTVTQGILSDTATNVLVGEVWVAGGQSNMDRPFWTYVTLDHRGKDNSNIRIVDINFEKKSTPTDNVTISDNFGQSWQECKASYLREFSPAAYYFAAKLELEHGHSVPIGVIESTRGSSRAELWTSEDKLTSLGYPYDDYNSKAFNGMIYPLRKYTFRGVIFYQGESNANDVGVVYQKLFEGLVESWREAFGRGDIPFYFAQLSTYSEPNWDQSDDNGWPFLRAAQAAVQSMPNTGMVVTYDVGELIDIHPQDKQTVGERFAYHALALDGVTGFVGDSPEPSNFEVSANKIVVTFQEPMETKELKINKHINLPPGTDPEAISVDASVVAGFAVCGADHVFVEAEAVILDGNQVVVSSPYIDAPKAVRYCWKSQSLCNLYSVEMGLPSQPFRSDSFPQPQMDGKLTGVPFTGDAVNPGALLGDPTKISAGRSGSSIVSEAIDGTTAHIVSRKNKSGKRIVYFKTENPIFEDPTQPYVLMRILYYDEGDGIIRFRHYSRSTNENVFGESDIILQDTKTWRYVEMLLRDVVFDGRYSGNDLRVESLKDFTIGGIFLSSVSSPFPLPFNVDFSASTPAPTSAPSLPPVSVTIVSGADMPSVSPVSQSAEKTDEYSAPHITGWSIVSVPQPVQNGDEIDINDIGNSLNIIATVDDVTKESGSVVFVFQGVTSIESKAPYAVGGDVNGVYNKLDAISEPGEYTVEATPFSEIDGGGVKGETVTFTFSIKDSRIQ